MSNAVNALHPHTHVLLSTIIFAQYLRGVGAVVAFCVCILSPSSQHPLVLAPLVAAFLLPVPASPAVMPSLPTYRPRQPVSRSERALWLVLSLLYLRVVLAIFARCPCYIWRVVRVDFWLFDYLLIYLFTRHNHILFIINVLRCKVVTPHGVEPHFFDNSPTFGNQPEGREAGTPQQENGRKRDTPQHGNRPIRQYRPTSDNPHFG